MKRLVLLTAASLLTIGSAALAASGTSSPTATHDNPSSCLGAERATRNSDGGDRAQGGFGPAQSAYVQSLQGTGQNYGGFLQDWKAACSNPPGSPD